MIYVKIVVWISEYLVLKEFNINYTSQHLLLLDRLNRGGNDEEEDFDGIFRPLLLFETGD